MSPVKGPLSRPTVHRPTVSHGRAACATRTEVQAIRKQLSRTARDIELERITPFALFVHIRSYFRVTSPLLRLAIHPCTSPCIRNLRRRPGTISFRKSARQSHEVSDMMISTKALSCAVTTRPSRPAPVTIQPLAMGGQGARRARNWRHNPTVPTTSETSW